MRSLPPSLTAPAWDFASAAPSSNRMVAACGLSTSPRAAQAFVLPYPPGARHLNDTRRPPAVFVIHELPPCVRPSRGARRSDELNWSRPETWVTERSDEPLRNPEMIILRSPKAGHPLPVRHTSGF